jgi:hypothetical protein
MQALALDAKFAHALGGHARFSAESRRELVAGADDRVSSNAGVSSVPIKRAVLSRERV